LFAAALVLLATDCASLPQFEGRKETNALTDTAETRLGRATAPEESEGQDLCSLTAGSWP
jgi:hypothetical protein